MQYQLHHSDCLTALKAMPDNSIDAIVTDPPYGLSFMGKKWDYDVPSVEVWAECLRVLKPGGHLLAFAGTRTQHRMAVRIEDAGFEIRDMIAWVYGSGFPKSLDVSKAIDKAAGAEREIVGPSRRHVVGASWGPGVGAGDKVQTMETAPATEAARRWQGWGTAIKPALEPITVARKPLIGTVAENVLAHGTGALNIDGCRVAGEAGRPLVVSDRRNGNGVYRDGLQGSRQVPGGTEAGRWPANLIHDGSEKVLAGFPQQTSGSRAAGVRKGMGFHGADGDGGPAIEGSTGSAARFFYCAKASKRDRDEGLEHLNLEGPGRTCYDPQYHEGGGKLPPRTGNFHPTVKPTDLMRYLCRLVTPPGGVVLDPFTGSGSTGKAAMLEGFRFIGCELSAEYLEIARARIEAALSKSEYGANGTTQSDLFRDAA